MKKAEATFDYAQPAAILPLLTEAYRAVQKLDDGYWKRVKSQELKEVIVGTLGLFAEATAEDYSTTPGGAIELTMEIINRSPVDATLRSVDYLPLGIDTTLSLTLDNNQQYEFYKTLKLPKDIPYTNPYWLNKDWQLGLYTVEDQQLTRLAGNPRALKVRFNLLVDGLPLQIEREIVHKKTDPVKGETYRPFEITPPVFANITEKVYVFGDSKPQDVEVRVRAGRDSVKGKVTLKAPRGWRVQPSAVAIDLGLKGQERRVAFRLSPPQGQSEGKVSAVVELDNGKTYQQGLNLIDYDHIPTQMVMLDNSARAVKIDLETAGQRIGYLMGAGDEIPNSLEQIGYEVTMLEEEDLTVGTLQQFDAVILGIRVYNTRERMAFYQPALFEYAKQGGTLITQYNTTWNLKMKMEDIAPYPLEISRDRVTVEEAEVRTLAPDHPVLNWPNKITADDFRRLGSRTRFVLPRRVGRAIYRCSV